MAVKATITKQVTDMAKYGITGANRWAGDVIIKSDQSINVHGKYFPTEKQASDYADKVAKDLA
jgi:hypothetical protein